MARKSKGTYMQEAEFDEIGFNMPLQIRVEGRDVYGMEFKENTVLSYISHRGSSFWLMRPVTEGSELRLMIDLPPKLSSGKNLKLIIRGKVVFVEAPRDREQRHRVSLKFDNKYIIKNENP